MKPRNTLIVVALFALLLGYVYFVEINKTPEQLGTPVPTPQLQVFSVATNNVKNIEIRDLRAPRQVTLTRTENGWQVQQPQTKNADSPAVDSAVNQLTSLSASRVLTNVTDIAPYGFVTATLEIRLVMSDTTPYALTVGNKTPDGSNYYVVYTGDRSKVFIVPSGSVDSLKSWLDTPPYEPTPTPTATPTLPETPTPQGTPGAEGGTPTPGGPTAAPPNIVPTVALPPPAGTPTP